MPVFVFTFPVGGPNRDRFIRVYAPDEEFARLQVIGVYGRSGWASCYPWDEGERIVGKYDLIEMAF